MQRLRNAQSSAEADARELFRWDMFRLNFKLHSHEKVG
jgi:hypothetical protein